MIINPEAQSTEWRDRYNKQSWLSVRICPGSDLVWGEERIMELKYDEIMLKTVIMKDEMITLQLSGRKLG